MLSVLLVDDEPALLEILVQMAQRSQDIRIQPAQSAKEALKILGEQSFDVIITDYLMPDMNGIVLITRVRSSNYSTPIILYSDSPDDHVAIEALNSGANYYVRKDRDPRRQFHEIVEIVKKMNKQSVRRRSADSLSRIIGDLINFSSDPSFAINQDGIVIAWNDSIEQLTGVPADSLLGKGDLVYSEPFHGKRKKMLADLVFESDDKIRKEKYMIISRIKNGPIIGVTRGVRKDGSGWTIWSKAMPVSDASGQLHAVIATIRDVTATFGDIIAHESAKEPENHPAGSTPARSKKPGSKLLGKLLNSATNYYKEGVVLFAVEKDYQAAIEAFDRALEIDDSLAYIWNDRGVCYRELGDYTNALKSSLRAVELAPGSPQCLFTLGETLEQIGIMYMSNKYLDSAVQTFKMVVDQHPNNADAWSHIGVCYKQMGKMDESKFHLNRARDIRLGGKDTPLGYTREEYL